jgi:phytoene dehydrogenase-like protein
MTERVDALIIGAGHNGLVCAAYLARAGMRVICLESSDAVGGMSAPRKLAEHYRFPGLVHTAFPVNTRIRRDLKLDQFDYQPGPAVDTVALALDGRHLTISPDSVSGEALSDTDQRSYRAFREQYLSFAKTMRPLLESKAPRLRDMELADKATLAKLGWGLRMGLGRESMYEFLRVAAINIYDVLNETFDDERLKAAIAVDAVLGNAMGPRTPGTVLTWLQKLHNELNGPMYVVGSSGSQLSQSLARSAESAGATLRSNAHVEKILVENGEAVGVRLANGEILKAGTIVSNADPRATFTELVGAPQLDAMFANRVTQIRGSGVVAKLHLALGGLPEFTNLPQAQLKDRIVVAPTLRYIEQAFNSSKYDEYSKDPVLEITLPSLHDNSLAPQGHHVMSINVAYVPYELPGGWETQRQTLVDQVISQLGQYAPNLKSLLVDHEFLTPQDIEKQFSAVKGHWHHGELSIHQSFMMRPLYGAAQYDTPIDGLFLCGAGSHPGGGLTGLPGQNAAQRILKLGRKGY